MAKKGKTKSLDNSQHVFHSRFSWDMSWPLFNFYSSAPNISFHISPAKVKVHSFFHVFSGVNRENCALLGKTS